MAGLVATPSNSKTATTRAVVSPTCRPPPRKIARQRRTRRSRLNSIPIVNRSRITPTSAAASTISRSVITPRALGPIDDSGEQESDDRHEADSRAEVSDQRAADE